MNAVDTGLRRDPLVTTVGAWGLAYFGRRAIPPVPLVVAHAAFSRGVRGYESGNQLVTNV